VLVEHAEIYRSTMKYALAIAGSDAALALRLRVPFGTLKNWLSGIEPIPDAVFLDAVDVIAAATPAEIARSREALRAHPVVPLP